MVDERKVINPTEISIIFIKKFRNLTYVFIIRNTSIMKMISIV